MDIPLSYICKTIASSGYVSILDSNNVQLKSSAAFNWIRLRWIYKIVMDYFDVDYTATPSLYLSHVFMFMFDNVFYNFL